MSTLDKWLKKVDLKTSTNQDQNKGNNDLKRDDSKKAIKANNDDGDSSPQFKENEIIVDVDDEAPGTSKTTSGTWYKGYKLDLSWMLQNYGFLQKTIQLDGKRNRPFICCSICREFKTEAAKVSKRGTVPLAEGIRVDGEQKLKRIVDHIESSVHSVAAEAQKSTELWKQQSEKHPWVNTLKKTSCGSSK
ncbi:uncharacterized protein [Eurosta solidaginis]|uniref:uncharacterized protein n=1 Tax=Eurosta solidaginis TaxID=178769 RepID=UPI003530F7A4